MIIRFLPDAEAEMFEAELWYGQQRKGLDQEFIQSIKEAVGRLHENPSLYPVVYRRLRRILVRKFPYAIYYTSDESSIHIVAVFHTKRNPKRWKARL